MNKKLIVILDCVSVLTICGYIFFQIGINHKQQLFNAEQIKFQANQIEINSNLMKQLDLRVDQKSQATWRRHDH